jgi:hypothetical protein
MVDFGNRGVPSTMFPPEFLTTTDNQSTEVTMGGEPQPQDKPSPNPPAQLQQEMQNLLYLESFQDVLDNMWPATELEDATLVQLQAFVLDGVRIADKALKEFDRIMLELKQEKEVQQTKTWELEDILDVSITARLGKITADMNAIVYTIAENCEASSKTFARLSEAIADTKRTQHAVNAKFDASFTHLSDRLQKHDAQVAQTMESIEKSLS